MLLVLLPFSPLLAQTGLQPTEYIGTLQLENAQLITYKIAFTADQQGHFKGISHTDFYGENCTQAKIEGTVDVKKGVLSFKEIANINTKSNAPDSEFCFIRIENAKIKNLKGKAIIQGAFTGYFKNKEKCAAGNIYLISNSYVEALSQQFEKKTEASHDSAVLKAKEKLNAALVESKQTILKSNGTFKVKWHSNEIVLAVWDGEKLDQDKVTIYADGKPILENFVIKKEKKIIVIPFPGSACKLKIVAMNEGEVPPNTVNAELLDDTEVTPFISSLNKGEATFLTIEKEK